MRFMLLALLALALLACNGASESGLEDGARGPNSILPDPDQWHELPSFTMRYELADGQAVNVGGRTVDPRQVKVLEYTGVNQWVDTVVESADIDTRVGTFSNVGSYQRQDGDVAIDYDPVTGETYIETRDPSDLSPGVSKGFPHRTLPGGFLIPFWMGWAEREVYGIVAHGLVQTEARVCFNEVCEDNHWGRSYTDNGVDVVYVDDARGIPLQKGGFKVLEVHIHSDQIPVKAFVGPTPTIPSLP